MLLVNLSRGGEPVKYYDTVTRYRFTTKNRVNAEQVERDLAQMVAWIAQAEQEVLNSQEFYDLAVKALSGNRPTETA